MPPKIFNSFMFYPLLGHGQTNHSECNRLATFKEYPECHPASPLRLAAAGFTYTGQEDEVTCHFCRFTKRGWRRGDKPEDIHRQASRNCPLYCSSQPGGTPPAPCNVPIPLLNVRHGGLQLTDTAATSPQYGDHALLPGGHAPQAGDHALLPGGHAPQAGDHAPQAGDHALLPGGHAPQAGDHAAQHGDDAPRSGGHAPQSGGHALQVRHHALVSGDHASLQDSQSVNLPVDLQQQRVRREMGVELRTSRRESVGGGLHPAFTSRKNRTESFRCSGFARNKVLAMAHAGFFYAGVKDVVICYHCGLQLHEWQETDDPATEHARHRPTCSQL